MRKNSTYMCLLAIIAFVIGGLFGSAISNWDIIKITYEVRLIEIGQLLVTILIAVFITYIVTRKVNYELKKRELLNDLILKFQSHITSILELGYNYIESPDKIKESKINRMFKDASVMLKIMIDIKKSNSHLLKYDDEFVLSFWKFKGALTDSPFGQKSPKYSEDRVKQIQEEYSVILNKLYGCRLDLYSGRL